MERAPLAGCLRDGPAFLFYPNADYRGVSLLPESGGEGDTVLYRAAEGELVGVLEVVSDGDTAGEGADTEVGDLLEEAVDVKIGRIALHGGAEGEEDFLHPLILYPLRQVIKEEVIGADAVDGRDEATEDVVPPVVAPRLLYRQHLTHALDDADEPGVASGVAADGAELLIADIVALAAVVDAVDEVSEVIGEPVGEALVLSQEEECQS